MPPKAKFTRDQIIQAGLDIVRKNGMEALSARALGTELGSSARPIFTVFQNMEEVQDEVVKSAKLLYAGYVRKGLEQDLAFKGVGTQYILFAMQEPKLFQLLFMSEQEQAPRSSMYCPHWMIITKTFYCLYRRDIICPGIRQNSYTVICGFIPMA